MRSHCRGFHTIKFFPTYFYKSIFINIIHHSTVDCRELNLGIYLLKFVSIDRMMPKKLVLIK